MRGVRHWKRKTVAQHHPKFYFSRFSVVIWGVGTGRNGKIGGKGQFCLMPPLLKPDHYIPFLSRAACNWHVTHNIVRYWCNSRSIHHIKWWSLKCCSRIFIGSWRLLTVHSALLKVYNKSLKFCVFPAELPQRKVSEAQKPLLLHFMIKSSLSHRKNSFLLHYYPVTKCLFPSQICQFPCASLPN